jgi:tripartite-type tricarboxylate transporter receptor subunit TctC
MNRITGPASLAALAAASITGFAGDPAEAADPFYKDKTMTVIVSTGGYGSYGNIARLFKRYMPAHLAGEPTILVKAMPGAGNVLATNYLYNVAPKDGTVIGTINNSIPLHQVIDGRGVRYDARKFNWLGSTGNYNSIAITWHTTGIKTFQDAMEKEVIYGGTGPASSIVIYPTIMNKVLGAKFKVLIGYKSVQEIDVAMEKGEVHGRTGSYSSFNSEHPDWFKNPRKVNVLIQVGARKDKALPDVPLMSDLAKNDADKQLLRLISSPIGLGRPYLAPPDVPAERVALLRKALADTMTDKGFMADASRMKLALDPITGEELTQLVNETINAHPDAVARARVLMPKKKSKKKKKKEG